MTDRYYEPADDEIDAEDFDNAVSEYAADLMLNDCNPNLPKNWAEGLSECGYDESDYPTPSHANIEIVHRVSDYWYATAMFIATKYYENHPEDLYD
jgi:hypothetical protein